MDIRHDKYPIRKKTDLGGLILRCGASIGANATLLPEVEICKGAMVAAGALVSKDVPLEAGCGFPRKDQGSAERIKDSK